MAATNGTSEPVGILVDRKVLHRALGGRRTYERISLYREVSMKELGVEIILFSVDGIQVKRNRVRGYVPAAQGWRKVSAAIPKVIHKRVLYRTSGPIRKLNRVQRQGAVFVNPYRMQNKEKMHVALSRHDGVRPHLPYTRPYRWRELNERLEKGLSVILKPRVGSVGQGILRLVPLPNGRVRLTAKKSRVLSRRRLHKYLGSITRARRYLLQEYLPLAQVDGRPFDLRVPVQRDGTGIWQVPGMVAKVAGAHPFLTNLAQGGRAIPGEVALSKAFSPAVAAGVSRQIERLAISVAQAVAARHPHAADLGLDIGVDRDGKPWLIEVNTRDQRITFYEAGLQEAFRTLYKNPIAYCALLTRQLRQGTC